MRNDARTWTAWPADVFPIEVPFQTGASWPTTTTVGNVQLWPHVCAGDVHVWDCGHTVTCKCGAATRIVPAFPCPHCGKV